MASLKLDVILLRSSSLITLDRGEEHMLSNESSMVYYEVALLYDQLMDNQTLLESTVLVPTLKESPESAKKMSIVRETTSCAFGMNMGYRKYAVSSSSNKLNASICIPRGTTLASPETSPQSSSL